MLRQQDYEDFVSALEQERLAFGDKTFPPAIQNAIDSYDLESEYLNEAEIPILLNAFAAYTQNNFLYSLDNYYDLCEEFLDANLMLIYDKSDAEDLSPAEKNIIDYYTLLLGLRMQLLKIVAEPGLEAPYDQAQKYIETLKKMKLDANDFQKRMNGILGIIHKELQNKINTFHNRQLINGGILSACVFMGVLMQKEPAHRALFFSVALSAIVALGTKYIAMPVSRYLSNNLFANQQPNKFEEKASDVIATRNMVILNEPNMNKLVRK